jgi:hypothetical protein
MASLERRESPKAKYDLAGKGEWFGFLLGGFFGWGVGFEPGVLLWDEFVGGLAEVAQGFKGDLAGDVIGVVVRQRAQGGGPAVVGVEDFGEDLAQVGVAGGVVVEVVGELVGDGGELLDEVVGVLLAAGAAGMGVEVLNLLDAEVEELDEEEDALGGVVAGFADLLDLCVGEGGLVALGVEGSGCAEGGGD